MKWFRHDSSAHRDTKVKRLKNKHGIVGYGLYWYCLELIAGNVDKKNISFELEDDADLIAIEWKLEPQTVNEILAYMVKIELFEIVENRVTCLKMSSRLDDTNSRNPEIQSLQKKLALRANELSLRARPENPGKSSEIPEESSDRLDKTRLDKTRLEETRLEKEKISASSKRTAFLLPDEISNQDFKDLEDHRKAIKKPMTDRAKHDISRNIIACAALNKITTSEVIGHAITKGWIGIGADWSIETGSSRAGKTPAKAGESHSERGQRMAQEREARMNPQELVGVVCEQ